MITNMSLFDPHCTALKRGESTLPGGEYDGSQLTEQMLSVARFKKFKADRKKVADSCALCDQGFGLFRCLITLSRPADHLEGLMLMCCRWKHMCTCCMEVVCDDCSKHRRAASLRVCERCHLESTSEAPSHEVRVD